MGIFDRFNRVLKSNLNSLVDRAEDPAKLLDQTVLDMENELKRAKKELVTQLGTAKRLEKKVAEHDEEVKGWEDKAVLALRAGDEMLAREALKMKQKAKATQDNVQKQADAAFGSARDLQSREALQIGRLEGERLELHQIEPLGGERHPRGPGEPHGNRNAHVRTGQLGHD